MAGATDLCRKQPALRHVFRVVALAVAATATATAVAAEAPPAMLGVVPTTQAGQAIVQELYVGAPAQIAGILPGDRILQIDGKPIRSAEGVISALAAYQPGTRVDVLVSRDGWIKHLHVWLARRADVVNLARTHGVPAAAPKPRYIEREAGYLDPITIRNIMDPFYRARYTRFGPN